MTHKPPSGFCSLEGFPRVIISAKYGTADNFTSKPLPGYASDLWLIQPAALQLRAVIEELLEGDLGLLIWDAYRPRRATLAMIEWAEKTGQSWLVEEGYIARRSRHNGGAAIDLTLIDWSDKSELNMGTEWDTFEEASHTLLAEGQVLENRLLLQSLMKRHGWLGYEKEWWHFELEGAAQFPLRDVPYGLSDAGEDLSIC